jgi:hypothetical protein
MVLICAHHLQVLDHQVPLYVRDVSTLATIEWSVYAQPTISVQYVERRLALCRDLALQQILPYINGVNYVKGIAVEADVELRLGAVVLAVSCSLETNCCCVSFLQSNSACSSFFTIVALRSSIFSRY